MDEIVKGCPSKTQHDREVPDIDLLSPLTIRDVTFRNRIVMSPMCQYCAEEGMANDWHLVHLGSRAVGGAALIMVEATAVTREGRISPGDISNLSRESLALSVRKAPLPEFNSPTQAGKPVAICPGEAARH